MGNVFSLNYCFNSKKFKSVSFFGKKHSKKEKKLYPLKILSPKYIEYTSNSDFTSNSKIPIANLVISEIEENNNLSFNTNPPYFINNTKSLVTLSSTC